MYSQVDISSGTGCVENSLDGNVTSLIIAFAHSTGEGGGGNKQMHASLRVNIRAREKLLNCST